MNWIFLAIVSGSILTSGHDTKEQCLGRKSILAEQKIEGKCVEAPKQFSTVYSGRLLCVTPTGTGDYQAC
jgi:hypothetical protein